MLAMLARDGLWRRHRLCARLRRQYAAEEDEGIRRDGRAVAHVDACRSHFLVVDQVCAQAQEQESHGNWSEDEVGEHESADENSGSSCEGESRSASTTARSFKVDR